MKALMRQCVFLIGLLLATSQPTAMAQWRLEYKDSQSLPDIRRDGQPVRIHTQGLYVTDTSFYVTGRDEQEPKRAVLLKFNRVDPRKFQWLEITPDPPDGKWRLDHPGGFDHDGESLWIPLARSRPQGPSLIVQITLDENKTLDKLKPETVFQVEDHIGAIAWDPMEKLLYGANWDTKKVYAWDKTGNKKLELDRMQVVAEDRGWQLAVQDWKFASVGQSALPNGVLIAGGIDKSPVRAPDDPRAVIDLLDPLQRKRIQRIPVPQAPEFSGTMTNEGLAVHDGHVYLLPADIGKQARVFRYRIVRHDRQR